MSALPWRLKRLMQHRCDIYRPKKQMGLPGANGAADAAFELKPFYTNVQCYYQGTPEFDTVTAAGITLDVNIMTSDVWWFLQTQAIADAWLIVMRVPGHPLDGRAWISQGNQFMIASMPGRNTFSQSIYTRQAPDSVIPHS